MAHQIYGSRLLLPTVLGVNNMNIQPRTHKYVVAFGQEVMAPLTVYRDVFWLDEALKIYEAAKSKNYKVYIFDVHNARFIREHGINPLF